MTYSFILIEKKIKRKTKNLLRQGAISTVATKKKKKRIMLCYKGPDFGKQNAIFGNSEVRCLPKIQDFNKGQLRRECPYFLQGRPASMCMQHRSRLQQNRHF